MAHSRTNHRRNAPVLLLLLMILGVQAIDNRVCYWPNGSRAPNYLIPCDSNNSTTTHCCWAGELCLSNGLCFGQVIGVPYRGACTDKTWNNRNCPPVCSSVNSDGSNNLWKCEAPVDQSKWDCGKNLSAICKDSSQLFNWPSGSIYKIAGDMPRTSTVDASGNSLTVPATKSSGSPTDAANSTAQSGSSNNGGGTDNSVVLGVGLGLGIPLAIALVVLGLWTLRERKLRKQAAANNADVTSSLMQQQHDHAPIDKYGSQPHYSSAYESTLDSQQPYQPAEQPQQQIYEMPNERPLSEMQTPPPAPVSEQKPVH